jgi:phosphonatase-like hydrolase
MNLPELIVFDLAGTTVEDHQDVHRMLQRALERYHVPITLAEANAVMGIPKPVAIETLLKQHRHPDITSELIQDIHAVFVKEMIAFYKTDPGVVEKPGVSVTFQNLRDLNIKVAVDTGFDRAVTTPLLERMGWIEKRLIDVSVTSDEVPQGRPHPDMIFRAMELTRVKEVGMVMKVGDTSSDIQEGKNARCGWVVGVTTGAFGRKELQKDQPTHLVEGVPDILTLLGI